MRVLVGIILSFLLILPAVGANTQGSGLMLNTVTMRLNAEEWIKSNTALVTVGVSSLVNGKGLETLQDTILKKLNTLSAGDWHIISFDRSLDQSGLEKVQIAAQARLSFSVLGDLRDKVKTMSKPGEAYSLDNLQFTASEDELRLAMLTLRNNIYQQAKEESDRLSKLYTERYYVHDVNFLSDIIPAPQNLFMQARAMAGNATGLTVSNKLVLSATVVLSAMPDQSFIKFVQ